MTTRQLTILICVVALLRVLFLGINGLELAPDEAYYWDWSRQLDICYYSKPPMVAWAIAASTAIFGDNEFGVRLPAVLFGTVGLLALLHFVRLLYNERAAMWAVLLVLCSPANMLFNLLMTIDAPLMCFWSLSLLGIAKALNHDKEEHVPTRLVWWAIAGLFGGLAILSKQTAFAIPAMTGFFLLITPKLRSQLWQGFLLYAGMLVAAFTPILYWNSQNGWITFIHTSEHFGSKKSYDSTLDFIGDRIGDFIGFAAAEFALASPISFVLMAICTIACTIGFFQLRPSQRWLYLLGPLPFIGVFGLAMLQRVQPNWPAPFLITTLTLTAGYFEAQLAFKDRSFLKIPASRWLTSAVLVGGVMAMAFYLIPVFVALPGIGPKVEQATRRIHEWDRFAADIQRLREQADMPEGSFILYHGGRGEVSTLAFYLPDQPRVYLRDVDGIILNQHDWWMQHRYDMEQYLGKDALYIVGAHEGLEADRHIDASIRAIFDSFEHIGLSETLVGTGHTYRYHVFRAKGLKSWPAD